MPRLTDYRNPEANMHGTLKHTITRFRKPIPVFPSGQKTHAARDGNGSAARNAKRQFFRCSDGTEERFSGRLRAACRNARRTVPYSRPYAAERTEKPCRRSKRRQQRPHAWPAEPGRKDKEPDRPKRKPTGTRRAYESWGIPVPHAQNHGMPHSIRLRPRIRTGARPKASDRLCLNRAARL